MIRLHTGLHAVEQAWSNEESLLVALQRELTTVDHQFGALFHAQRDIVFDLLPVRRRNHGTILRLVIARDAHIQGPNLRYHALT